MPSLTADRERLVLESLPLVHAVADALATPLVDRDDLIQEGSLALIDALDVFALGGKTPSRDDLFFLIACAMLDAIGAAREAPESLGDAAYRIADRASGPDGEAEFNEGLARLESRGDR